MLNWRRNTSETRFKILQINVWGQIINLIKIAALKKYILIGNQSFLKLACVAEGPEEWGKKTAFTYE